MISFPVRIRKMKGGGKAGEQLECQTVLWNYIFRFLDSMSLKCAVELGIPDAILLHGGDGPVSLPELIAGLGIPAAKSSHFRRLMRFLSHSGFFTLHKHPHHDPSYSLTPLSRLLLKDGTDASTASPCQAPFVIACLHTVLVEADQAMSGWFRSGRPDPFEAAHGCGLWDYLGQNPGISEVFNEGMASDARFVMSVFMEKCPDMLQGVGTVVDVAGGTGATARAIAKAFPHVKCTVLDLPHVVQNVAAETVMAIDFVAGNMFEYIPQADVVFLKWILHNWSDEDCVKILKRSKEAIIRNPKGTGKVIIIDMVIGTNFEVGSNEMETKAQLFFDMLMMTRCGGSEREEGEWKKIFNESGFTNYKITSALGTRSVIELYP